MKRLTLAMAFIAIALVVYAAPPAQPTTPARVKKLIFAQQFTLTTSYEFAWRKEKPDVTGGWILVLKVDSEYVRPRQTLEPVLYVGDQTAERVNIGFKSGYVVAIVPSSLDLTQQPIWFGDPDLPERIDAAKIELARDAAIRAKIAPFSPDDVSAARNEAVEKFKDARRDKNNVIPYAGQNELRRALAPLIRLYAPDEHCLCNRLEMIPRTPNDT